GRHHLGIRGRLFLGIGGRDHFGIRGRIASEFAVCAGHMRVASSSCSLTSPPTSSGERAAALLPAAQESEHRDDRAWRWASSPGRE
ncbi:hypothetical protein CN210_32070, partial [Sinorhizobium meliloti]